MSVQALSPLHQHSLRPSSQSCAAQSPVELNFAKVSFVKELTARVARDFAREFLGNGKTIGFNTFGNWTIDQTGTTTLDVKFQQHQDFRTAGQLSDALDQLKEGEVVFSKNPLTAGYTLYTKVREGEEQQIWTRPVWVVLDESGRPFARNHGTAGPEDIGYFIEQVKRNPTKFCTPL